MIQDLQTWKALLRCNDVIMGKLENPLVSCAGLVAFWKTYLCVNQFQECHLGVVQLNLNFHPSCILSSTSGLHRRCIPCFQGFILPYVFGSLLYWDGDDCQGFFVAALYSTS